MYFETFPTLDVETMCRALGLIGFSLYVFGFMLLSTGRLNSAQPVYFVMTLIAAACVLTSLAVDFNLSSAMIQIFYIGVSILAVLKRVRFGRATA